MNEPENTPPANNANEAPPGNGASESVPLSQVQSMIATAEQRAKDAAFAEARRVFEGKKGKDQRPQPSPANDNGKSDPTMGELLALRDTFDDSIESVKFPNKRAKGKMREEFLQARPQNANEWIKDYAETMGWVAQATESPPPEVKPRPTNTVPQSDGGAPAANTLGERPVDVLTWTEEDRDAFMLRHPDTKVPGNWRDVRNRKVLQELRRMTQAALVGRNFYVGPPKGR